MGSEMCIRDSRVTSAEVFGGLMNTSNDPDRSAIAGSADYIWLVASDRSGQIRAFSRATGEHVPAQSIETAGVGGRGQSIFDMDWDGSGLWVILSSTISSGALVRKFVPGSSVTAGNESIAELFNAGSSSVRGIASLQGDGGIVLISLNRSSGPLPTREAIESYVADD